MKKLLEIKIALDIGNRIIQEVGFFPELEGKYKEWYEEYTKKADEDIEYCKREGIDYVDLEFEKVHIECFCRWLQEEKLNEKE